MAGPFPHRHCLLADVTRRGRSRAREGTRQPRKCAQANPERSLNEGRLKLWPRPVFGV